MTFKLDKCSLKILHFHGDRPHYTKNGKNKLSCLGLLKKKYCGLINLYIDVVIHQVLNNHNFDRISYVNTLM